MGLLTKEQIKAACGAPLPFIDVSCPDYGGMIRVRGLTGNERDQWEATMSARANKGKLKDYRGFRASLVVMSAVDDDGQLLFSGDDIDCLAEGPARALSALFDAASRLSGLSKADEDEHLKNLSAAPSGVSG